MSESSDNRTILVPGVGLVTCVTETSQSQAGHARFTAVRSAVDEKGRTVDRLTWRRIERLLQTR